MWKNPTIFWDADGLEVTATVSDNAASTATVGKGTIKFDQGAILKNESDASGPDVSGSLQTFVQDRLHYKTGIVDSMVGEPPRASTKTMVLRNKELTSLRIFMAEQGSWSMSEGPLLMEKIAVIAVQRTLMLQGMMNKAGGTLGLYQAATDFEAAYKERSASRGVAGGITLVATGFGYFGTSLLTTLGVPIFLAPIADLLRIRSGEYSSCRTNTCHSTINNPIQDRPQLSTDISTFESIAH